MNRLTKLFNHVQQKKILMPYLCAGDPNAEITLAAMHALVKSGAGLIELGMPFSDPSADGEVIQRAHERALSAGASLKTVFELVTAFRKTNQTTPIILMGYYNPIFVTGEEKFIADCLSSGVDGVLLVDLPIEEGLDFYTQLQNQSVEPIYLLAPTSTDDRIALMAQHCKSFLYFVSLKGVTGSGAFDFVSVKNNLNRIRQLTHLPIAVGFGIKDPDSAKQVASVAEGVVIGSAYVKLLEQFSDDSARLIPELEKFTKAICVGMS